MDRNTIHSRAETIQRVIQIDAPPVFAQLGCGLLVVALLAVVFLSLILVYALLTGYQFLLNADAGIEAASDYLKYLASPPFQEKIVVGLEIMVGLLVAGGLIATVEAKKFLVWLKVR